MTVRSLLPQFMRVRSSENIFQATVVVTTQVVSAATPSAVMVGVAQAVVVNTVAEMLGVPA